MSPPERGWRRRWITSMVLPSWVSAVVLPDLADRGGLDHQQPGVVVDAVIVVAGAFAGLQARPDRLGQQVRHRGHLADEPAPARQGGQLQMLVLTGRIAGRPRTGSAGHHRLSASAHGSKIAIGITVAVFSWRLPPS